MKALFLLVVFATFTLTSCAHPRYHHGYKYKYHYYNHYNHYPYYGYSPYYYGYPRSGITFQFSFGSKKYKKHRHGHKKHWRRHHRH